MEERVQQRQLTPLQIFNTKIKDVRMQEYLNSVLGTKKDQFVTTLVSIVANNTKLQACEPMSIVYAALKSASLGLPADANLGYAALIPFNNTKANKTECQFQIMRNGWVELAQRTGQVAAIVNEAVHEGELVKKNKFTGTYIFDEEKKTSDRVIGYMAYVRLLNGFEKTVYWTREECEAHAKHYSQTYKSTTKYIHDSSMWTTNFDAMAKKTVLKNLITKYVPKSVELQNAILADQATFDESGTPNYIDAPEEQSQVSIEEAVNQQKEEMRQQAAEGKLPGMTEDLP